MLAPPGARARVASGSCCRSDRQPAGRRGDSPSCRCPVPQGRVRHRGCCPSCTGRVGLFQMTMTGMDLRAVPGGGPAAEAIGSAAEAAAELARGPRADRPGRRAFTLAYKLRMLTEYDATVPGLKGEMLRREVLYSMHMVEWRRAKDRSPRRTPRRGTEVAREGPPTRVGTARTWTPVPPRAPRGLPAVAVVTRPGRPRGCAHARPSLRCSPRSRAPDRPEHGSRDVRRGDASPRALLTSDNAAP